MMHESSHHVNQCAQVGHVYYHVWAVRCGHREAVTIYGRVWLDGPFDETLLIHEEEFEFGPFDSAEDIRKVYLELAARCVDRQLAYAL